MIIPNVIGVMIIPKVQKTNIIINIIINKIQQVSILPTKYPKSIHTSTLPQCLFFNHPPEAQDRSNRPGRSNAGSRVSWRLVAMMTWRHRDAEGFHQPEIVMFDTDFTPTFPMKNGYITLTFPMRNGYINGYHTPLEIDQWPARHGACLGNFTTHLTQWRMDSKGQLQTWVNSSAAKLQSAGKWW